MSVLQYKIKLHVLVIINFGYTFTASITLVM